MNHLSLGQGSTSRDDYEDDDEEDDEEIAARNGSSYAKYKKQMLKELFGKDYKDSDDDDHDDE